MRLASSSAKVMALAVLALLVSSCGSPAPGAPGAAPKAAGAGSHGGIAWVTDPAAGLAQAQKENKAAMMYFSAEW